MRNSDIWYSDKMKGREDLGIKRILSRGKKDKNASKLRSILLKVINNELTPRQKEIIMLYYFKDADVADISEKLGGVSAGGICGYVTRENENVQYTEILHLRRSYGNSCI